MKNTILSTVSACALATLFTVSSAHAQSEIIDEQSNIESSSAGEDESTMAVVYVTATKRSESTQDIPISVNVVDADMIADTGAVSLLQIEELAPGVQLVRSPTGKSTTGVTIRGLGSAPGSPFFESSVSLFVDGVYAPRTREFTSALFDVERIEVIKGTQAALLGKNTSAGAINVITRKPGKEFAADITGTYEFELESSTLMAGADLPISDELRFRIAAQVTDQGGWTENVISGEKATTMEDTSVRGVMVYEPNSNFDLTVMAQHSKTDLTGTPAEIVISSAAADMLQAASGYPGTIDGSLDRRNANGLLNPGEPGFETVDNNRAQMTANLELDGYTITSVTGWSQFVATGLTDGDGLAGNYLLTDDTEKSLQYLQELRLISPDTGRFSYIIGGMLFDNTLKGDTGVDARYPFGPAPGVTFSGAYSVSFHQATSAWSVFGQGTFDLTDQLRVIGGVRYTDEDKSFDVQRVVTRPGFYSVFLFPPQPATSFDRSESNFDYSVGLQYDVSDDGMVYASYGKGTKAGGFVASTTNLNDPEFDTEEAKTLEAGIKWNGSGWQANAATFYTQIDGFQVVTFNGTQFVISNADLESKGFEVSSWWQASRNLRLSFDTTFAEARNADTGARIPNAPDWSGSLAADYSRSLTSALDLFVNGSVNWRSDVTYQQDPNAAIGGDDYTTLNASIGIGANDAGWRLSLIGRNLSDENTASFAYPTPFVGASSATSEMPRTIALQARLAF